MKVIHMSAKCSDLFDASLEDTATGKQKTYSGYVPDFFPGAHYGDYVILDIDVETGRILNWRKPSAADLSIFESSETE